MNLKLSRAFQFALLIAISFLALIYRSSGSAKAQSGPGFVLRPVIEAQPPGPASPIDPDTIVEVTVELIGEPAVAAYSRFVGERPSSSQSAARAVVRQSLSRVSQEQGQFLTRLSTIDVEYAVTGRLDHLFNGVILRIRADRIPLLRSLPEVRGVHISTPVQRQENEAVPFIGGQSFWNHANGNIGEGIRVGIIDSGIDYLHRNFGGPGTGYQNNDTTVIGDAPGFPGAIVAGGYDFTGDSYNFGDPQNNIPREDPDPMDCNGHGTGVASITAGRGVTSAGQTYSGPYDSTTPFNTLRIGPGVAPGATLYGLKVFGCTGTTSTAIMARAIDWAVDPNNDGDFSDHLDIINLSIGAVFSAKDSPWAASSAKAAMVGTLVVVSAGNNGDTYYIVNGLSSFAGNVSVAASVDTAQSFLPFKVNSPSGIAGQGDGARAEFGPQVTAQGVTGDLVATSPASACSPLTNQQQLAGKIGLVDRGGCNFVTKAQNVMAAGGTAMVVTNNQAGLPQTMGGDMAGNDVTIPSVMISQTQGSVIRNVLATQPVNVTISSAGITPRPDLADTVTGFSSRGPDAYNNLIKPDITAPGELTITTALAGSGAGDRLFNGTSAAAPMVAGSAALVLSRHSDWSVTETKALLLNLATADLFVSPNRIPPKYGPARVGSGRVMLNAAADASIIAYNTDAPELVNVSFGSVEVTGTVTIDKSITVVNKSSTPRNFQVSYTGLQDIPGVSYSFPDGMSISVAGNSSTAFRIRLTATQNAMRHSRDQTISPTLFNVARHYLSEEAGYISLSGSGSPPIRLAVYAAAKPVSNMNALQTSFEMANPTGMQDLIIQGQTVDTGGAYPFDITALAIALELQEVNPPSQQAQSRKIEFADLKNIGVRSNYSAQVPVSSSLIYFGYSTYGDWTSPGTFGVDIIVDSDRDGTDDYRVFLSSFANPQNGPSDVFVNYVQNLKTRTVRGLFGLNALLADQFDTNPYNTNVAFMVVPAAEIGLTSGNTRFNYRFRTAYGNEIIDQSNLLTYDIAAAGIDFGPNTIVFDRNGTTIPATYNRERFRQNGSRGVFLMHLHNRQGNRDQSLLTSSPAPTLAGISPESTASGGADFDLTVMGTGFNTASVVRWNGSIRPTTFFSQEMLIARIPASDILTIGVAPITVFTPAPGGGTTSEVNFSITGVLSYEADVAPRSTGDGNIDDQDLMLTSRFVALLETFGLGSEFQRLDCAPRSSAGDGRIDITDLVQVGRYSAAIDPIRQAGGPLSPVAQLRAVGPEPAGPQIAGQAATIRVLDSAFTIGSPPLTLEVAVDANGGENAFGFTIAYDRNVLSYSGADPAAALAGGLLTVNTDQMDAGRIGFILALPPGTGLQPGRTVLMTLRFDAFATTSANMTVVGLDDSLIPRQAANLQAGLIPLESVNGNALIKRVFTAVSAASFLLGPLAAESIASGFGINIANQQGIADTLPLPTTLAGTTISIRDAAGIDRLAELFFVAPAQINFHIPKGTAIGEAMATLTTGDGAISNALLTIAPVSPALFATDATGQGTAAAVVLRVRADGSQVFEPVSRFDGGQNRIVPVPIAPAGAGESLFLILFGTGVRGNSGLANSSLSIGGVTSELLFIGPQGGFVGLDQINSRLSPQLAGRGEVDVVLIVDGRPANTVKLTFQ